MLKSLANMKIKTKFTLITVVALLLSGLFISGISTKMVTDGIYDRMEETLIVAVEGYTDNVSYLKDMGEDIEITVFTGDTRTESSIPNVEGSKADSEVIEAVINNRETYFVRDIVVGGEDFCGYYKPTETGMLFAGKPKADLDAIQKQMIGTLAVSIAVFLIVISTVVIFIIGKISKKLSDIAGKLENLSEGDLTIETDPYSDSKNEISVMNNALMKLRNSLTSIVTELKSDAEQLAKNNTDFTARFADIQESAGNVSTAVEEIAQGATSQAQEATKAAEQVAEMGTIVGISEEAVASLDEAVERMNSVANSTSDVLRKLEGIVENTTKQVALVNEQTIATNESASQIQGATKIIQDIADQTNLLSLNASIEAARAGEAGRGFSVVAGEIRNLADSSSSNVKVIDEIIKELSKNSAESVGMMSEVLSNSNVQAKELADTLLSFQELSKEISVVAESTASILEQVKKLAVSRGVIEEVTETLSAVSEENAASTEETAASMQSLSAIVEDCTEDVNELGKLSNRLKEQVSVFKL